MYNNITLVKIIHRIGEFEFSIELAPESKYCVTVVFVQNNKKETIIYIYIHTYTSFYSVLVSLCVVQQLQTYRSQMVVLNKDIRFHSRRNDKEFKDWV